MSCRVGPGSGVAGTGVAGIGVAGTGVMGTGVAGGLLCPLVILPVVAVRYRMRVGVGIIIAGILAVLGVGLISWK